jgi:hypothetical protein
MVIRPVNIRGRMMDQRLGIIGTLLTWIFGLVSIILKQISTWFGFFVFKQIEFLQIVTLYLAVIVSCLTVLWYLGNMMIKRKELLKAAKEFWKDIWK